MQPFTLEPLEMERVWGGDRIANRFGRPARPGRPPIGESWEIHGDLIIREGEWAGRKLDEVVALRCEELFGPGADHASWPVLTKWLDSRDWLSVQVHPDDATARRLTGDPTARGKFECWYFVDVAPEAEVIHGWRDDPPARLEDLQGADWLSVVRRFRPQAGTWLTTPAGCVHALGPGLLLYEVQQSSDLTYRLYDWERTGEGRKLHPAESLESIREARPGPTFFEIEQRSGEADWQPATAQILVAPHAPLRLSWEGGCLTLSAGDSAVLPASAPALRLSCDHAEPWVRVSIPRQ